MDADTTATKGAHHRILEAFRTGEATVVGYTTGLPKDMIFPMLRCLQY